MHSIWQDIRIAFRMLANAPGINITAILVFGLGMASVTALQRLFGENLGVTLRTSFVRSAAVKVVATKREWSQL